MFDLEQKFNVIDNASTEQKRQNDPIYLVDDVLNENNPFNDLKTEDTYIEDNLFDNNDSKYIKRFLTMPLKVSI